MKPLRSVLTLAVTAMLVACGPPAESRGTSAPGDGPPPIPAGAETVVFERATGREAESQTEANDDDAEPPLYWGIEPGEPVPVMWEELMPEGALEDLIREQEAFYAMLQRRYSANASTLADADTFDEIEEGSALDFMPQLGSFEVVEELDGEYIRIPGYVVPFDFNPDQRHEEFLFVPYMGACIHTPPPPPNQIILVRADPAIRVSDIWVPYWLQGTMSAEQTMNELGDAAYALQLETLEPYPIMGLAD